MKKRTIFIAVLLGMFAVAGFSQTRGPVETVTAFYRYSDARSDLFDRRHIESRKQWYTPRLYNAFKRQLRADNAHLKKHPTDKPFFGDGLDFQPLHEACEAGGKSFNWKRRIGRAEVTRSTAKVDVIFAYPKACGIEPSRYRMQLKKIGGQWLVDDLIYPEGSSLTRDMAQNRYE